MDDGLHLNLFTMSAVEHVTVGSWRYPGDQSVRYGDRSYWTEVARTAERGGFDAIFFADVRGIYRRSRPSASGSFGNRRFP